MINSTTQESPKNNSNLNLKKIHKKNIHPIISEILQKRGLSSIEIENFFSWKFTDLPDLSNLIDLKKASQRIIQAINSNEKIAVYGDYDVDGTTSCALIIHFFKLLNIEINSYQPSRFIEGYGLHIPSIEKANEDGVKVLITVDCGITSDSAAKKAKEVGIDLIITDHHKQNPDINPDAFAIINPNQTLEEENNPLKVIAGVGVGFALALQIKKDLESIGKLVPSIYSLLEFVAVGTIADMAKLELVNLILVRHGLLQLKNTKYPGLKVFTTPDDEQLNFIPSERISFGIGPLINSKGRLEHPEMALDLLMAKNHDEAIVLYRKLQITNEERKFIQKQVFSEAKEKVISSIKDIEMVSNIVYSPDWHEGVIGIVASNLIEMFKVPAIVFTNSEEKNIIKASARAAGSIDLYAILKKCEHLFVKFGGHKAAAGLSMPKENLEEFKALFNKILLEYPLIERVNTIIPDAYLKFSDIDFMLMKNLEMLEPFGMGNDKPLFRSTNLEIESYQILKEAHVKWFFKEKNSKEKFGSKLSGITFNYFNNWNAVHPTELINLQDKNQLNIDFYLGINRFRGNEIIQLQVKQITY